MFQTLSRRLKRRLFRADYARLDNLVAQGHYAAAALLAASLGEDDLARRCLMLNRARIILARTTVPARDNPLTRCALEHRLKERRN